MSDQIDIEITLSSSFWDHAPKTRVFVDDSLVFDGEISELKIIKWTGLLSEGPHKLIIELYGKNKYQTVLKDGKIVKDQLLHIDSILFDEIDVGYMKHSLSKYFPDKTVYPSEEVPEVLNNCVNLGYNGRWELTFSMPIYIWLLENI
jgi:hypothetical protein